MNQQDLKQRIVQAVEADLNAIETALQENLNPHLSLVSDIASHLLFSGGKRLRPLLFLLSARLCGCRESRVTAISTLFEFLHAATLLHDDVVDGAAMRRGRQVAHSRWEASAVVLTGDFLLARSLSLAAMTGQPRVIDVIAGITEDMSQGEIEQMLNKGRTDLTRDEYMDVIRRKTAVLIQGACRTGAMVANASDAGIEALSDYGYHLGVAFQMADDLLDYTATADTLGKNPGADLREGKLTLPLILALERADEQDRKQIVSQIGSTDVSLESFTDLVDRLHHYNAIADTQEFAAGHVTRAKACLEMFEASPPREILGLLADYSIARNV